MPIQLIINAQCAGELHAEIEQLAKPLQRQLPEQKIDHSLDQKPEQMPKQLLDQKLEQMPTETGNFGNPALPTTSVKTTRIRTRKVEIAPATAPVSESEETLEDAPATHDDLKDLIRTLHQERGDDFLPQLQDILAEYGARKRSEVKDEDVPDVYNRIKSLKDGVAS